MKKYIKLSVLVIAVMVIGVVTVNAATTTLATISSYTINSGGEFSMSELKPGAGQNYAIATIDPSTVTSGTKKTVFVGYVKSLSYYLQKASKTTTFSTMACTKVSIGKIGSGTWKISNQAYSGSTKYAGWSGQLILSSSSAS